MVEREKVVVILLLVTIVLSLFSVAITFATSSGGDSQDGSEDVGEPVYKNADANVQFAIGEVPQDGSS